MTTYRDHPTWRAFHATRETPPPATADTEQENTK